VDRCIGVQAPDDPAIKSRRCAAGPPIPDVEIELVVGTRREGLNPKVSNLIGMFQSAKHDVLILSDSDIRRARQLSARNSGRAGAAGVGAVTCFYRGAARTRLWSDWPPWGSIINSYQMPCSRSRRVSPGLLRFDDRRQDIGVGGDRRLRAFEDRLADDYAIGAAIRSRG